jgi:hypothetical protein
MLAMDAPGTGSTERADPAAGMAPDLRTSSEAREWQCCAWGRAAAEGDGRGRAPTFPRRRIPGTSRHRGRRQTLARYEHSPRHVVEARYLGDYKVWLEFNDGRKGVVDLADELHGEELEPLRDRSRFAQFYLDYGLASIAWLDGQDFAPEFLYERLKEMH